MIPSTDWIGALWVEVTSGDPLSVPDPEPDIGAGSACPIQRCDGSLRHHRSTWCRSLVIGYLQCGQCGWCWYEQTTLRAMLDCSAAARSQ